MVEENFYRQDTLPLGEKEDRKTTPEPTPEKIGPYKIEALLERGGMSILYLATHPESKEPITIKVLSPKYVSNKEVVRRFLQEAEIIALTDHPNIVKLYGQGEWEGGLYIAMEFIRGVSLRQYILRNFMTLRKALEISLEIAYALCHLHSHGIIHRDLKPENILVNDEGLIKVIDFGIAQLLTAEAEKMPEGKKRLIGTPIYMSPEQKEHPESVSYPSDIYSLGIITYELVLGKLSHGLIHIPLMPYGLQKILAKCLKPNPDDRFVDVVDFITEISKYMNSADLRKDNTEKDQMERLSANLKRAQQTLSPHGPPEWPHVNMGLASHKGLNIFGMYYDFVVHPNNAYGIIIGEPSTKGAEGFIYTSVLRGMVRAISRLTDHPQEMAGVLNELLINDQMKPIISLSYLVLLPEKCECRFLSCGNGNVFAFSENGGKVEKVSSSQICLGLDPKAEFQEIIRPWNPGDSLLLQAFSTTQQERKDLLFHEETFADTVESTRTSPPQQQVDTLLAKTKIDCTTAIEDCSIVLIRATHAFPHVLESEIEAGSHEKSDQLAEKKPAHNDNA